MASPLYTLGLGVSVLVSVGVAAAGLQYRDRPGGMPLVALLVGTALWSGAALGYQLVATPAAGLFFVRLIYVGTVVSVTVYVLFALEFAGHEDVLTRPFLAALALEPLAVMALTWTGLGDGGFWQLAVRGGDVVTTGTGFWLHLAYSYVLVAVATAFALQAAARSRYRGQVVALTVGVFTPWLANALYQFGPLSVDPTPIAFSVTGLALFVAMRQSRLMQVVPVARERVLDTIDDAVFVVDDAGQLLDCNPAFTDLFDLDGDALGQSATAALDGYPEMCSLLEDPDDAVVAAETPAGERYLDVRTSRIGDGADSQGRLFVCRDVTEQQRRERALRENEQRYRTLAENIPEGIVALFDTDLRFTLVAGRALEGFDYSAEDFEGATLYEVHTEGYVERFESAYEAVFDGEEATFEFRHADRTYRSHLVPIERDGEVTAGMSITMDITDLKERERELRRQNQQLEQVTSFLSHDLRNPLNVASGRVRLAMETGDISHLETVVDAHDRMEQLIEDVLTLARQGSPDTELIDAGRIAREAWANVATDGAILAVDAGGTVLADEGHLKQLFENLFRNAVQHGGADVTVTVGRTEDGFYVADDGPGLPEDKQEAVFEAGFTDHEDGTGLGLSIVSNIAEAHGWTAAAGASESGGARFEFADVTRVDAPTL